MQTAFLLAIREVAEGKLSASLKDEYMN